MGGGVNPILQAEVERDCESHLFRRFPYGYAKQVSEIGEMMRPHVWSCD
jgi:hypothetical protein